MRALLSVATPTGKLYDFRRLNPARIFFRWATIPVVKIAQLEKVVDFPPELDAPWAYLQRNFGVISEGGNITSNVLHNFNEKGERVYKINVGMSELVRSSEETFFRMFYDVEVLVCIDPFNIPLLPLIIFQGLSNLLRHGSCHYLLRGEQQCGVCEPPGQHRC